MRSSTVRAKTAVSTDGRGGAECSLRPRALMASPRARSTHEDEPYSDGTYEWSDMVRESLLSDIAELVRLD